MDAAILISEDKDGAHNVVMLVQRCVGALVNVNNWPTSCFGKFKVNLTSTVFCTGILALGCVFGVFCLICLFWVLLLLSSL